jgi:hypothetical protein
VIILRDFPKLLDGGVDGWTGGRVDRLTEGQMNKLSDEKID